jgi:hypothetical protein
VFFERVLPSQAPNRAARAPILTQSRVESCQGYDQCGFLPACRFSRSLKGCHQASYFLSGSHFSKASTMSSSLTGLAM